jgi:hypothetical protein
MNGSAFLTKLMIFGCRNQVGKYPCCDSSQMQGNYHLDWKNLMVYMWQYKPSKKRADSVHGTVIVEQEAS